jgi:hypothetical protein
MAHEGHFTVPSIKSTQKPRISSISADVAENDRPRATPYLTSAGRVALHTDSGMADYLNWRIGRGQWVHDARADLWVALHPDYTGAGRAFIVFERGGEAHPFLVPVEALQ